VKKSENFLEKFWWKIAKKITAKNPRKIHKKQSEISPTLLFFEEERRIFTLGGV
jgi:hypothetical protein